MKKKNISIVKLLMLCIVAAVTSNAQQARHTNKTAISSVANSNSDSKYKSLWTAEPFDHKLFIKNAGQFDNIPNVEERIMFGAQVGRANAYFIARGVIYNYKNVGQPKKNETKEKQEREGKEEDIDTATHSVSLVWEGSNPNVAIEPDEKQSYFYAYPKGANGTIKTDVFKKITYKNLYPNIDVEYTFPNNKDGIKYMVIVHPGGDLSLVKLKYNGVSVSSFQLDKSGNAIIRTDIGKVTDHTPVSYYSEGGKAIINYKVTGNEETFAGFYDKSKTLNIDPWTFALVFTGGYNQGYDIDYDYNGNIYVQGAWGPEQLAKYNSAGAKQWIFNETTINTGATPCYGDFCVNRNNGECYVAEGDRETATGANILKINTLSSLMTTYGGNVDYQEMWRIGYNSCKNILVIAGGGTNANNQAATIDTGFLTPIVLVNSLAATCPYHDMVLLALDPSGSSCYMASSESCDFICTQASADDRLLKMPLPSLTPNTFNIAAPTTGSFPEDIQDVNYMTWSGTPTNGFNGGACSSNYLYTYDGADLHQQNKTTGATIKTVSPGTTQQSWGGLDVDACDNVYAGTKKSVKEYNSAMTLVNTFTATNTVYDLALSQNGSLLYVTGEGFIQVFSTGNTSVSTVKVTNPVTCGACNGTARADLTICGTVDTTGATYLWSNGATTHTITGLCAGTYSVTITPPTGCMKYRDSVTVTSGGGLSMTATPVTPSFCPGGSTGITATGATTYTWSPATGLNQTTGATVTSTPSATITYTVTGTTGLCTGTVSVVVTVNPTPTVNATAVSPNICQGGSTNINASGGTTYTWSPATGLNQTTGATVNANPSGTQTYTVTGTSSGCSGNATVTVTVNPTPTINANAVTPIFCQGGSSVINATGGSTYTWSPATGLNQTTGAAVTASPGSSNTYTVTGTDINGCNSTATVAVTVNPLPTINATADTATICAGSSTNINATGGSTYTWASSTGLSATTGGTVKATPGSSITYTVTGTDINGCINKATVPITIAPLPTVNATAVSPTICPGSSTNINATGATTYTWATGTGLNQTTGATVSADPASAITYTVTGTTAAGCVGTATVSIAIAPSLSVTITPSGGTTLCNGASVTLNAGGATSYSWSPPGGLSCTGCSNPTANPGSTTTYTVTGTSGTCTGKDSVVITINSTPTVNITPSAPAICTGDSVTLTASGATSYTWSPPGGLSCTSCSNTTAIPGSTSTYTVIGTIAGGCTGKDSVVVSLNPTPTVSVNSTGIASEICPGDTMGLIASGATTYTWSPATGLNVTTGIHVIASPGATTTYTVTGYNGNLCSDTASIVVLVYPKTTVSILPASPSICFGDSVTLNASGATTYSWLPNSGLSCVLCSNPSVSPSSTTTYTVTGKGTGGCASKDSITVTINPLPTLTITPTAPVICKGASVPLVVSGATSYTWSPPGGLSCTSCDSTTANPGSTVIYTVTGTSAGCTAKDSVTVTIDIPVVAISASSSTICAGGSTMLSATGAANYTWSPPGGLSCTSCSNTTAIPGSTTSYSVTGIDTNGCSDSAVISINVAAKLNVSMPNDSICSGAPGSVSVSTSGGTPVYIYTWSNSLGSGTGPYVVNPPTSTYYYCTVTDGCGDTVKDSSHVIVVSAPHVSFTGTPNTIPGGQYVTFTNTSTNATSFYWNFGNGNYSTDTSAYEQYNAQGKYVVYLIGSNALGCADTAWDTIYVTQGIYVPNVFTPNGDGQNDVFHVTASGLETYNIEIFNRWGQRVFTADSPNIDWSGRSTSGVEDSDGTYYYIIKASDFHNTQYNFHGYLELIR
jgi:gliding motility-associated-like protein